MSASAMQAGPSGQPLDKETLLTVYRKMRTIREFEDACTWTSAAATFPASCTCTRARRPPVSASCTT